ncbi:glycosyl transferase family 2 [Thiorhodococcus drewsii AZ1]|uniref:Glycosyl transferase family 2 n=1 Tax=Thiorhodococcus drewsii AZ1 TaxID=765913 RepID=G2DW01_9GAMM|nr:glycosyltransferase [Thiorhodococcus drewsii]EGV33907.1 glycosyl transferase family 2 [Thiorhodococcus drewsii AZ1]
MTDCSDPAASTSEGDGFHRPLISVVIRSIDRDTLVEALDSIAAQTYPRIECLVVNAKGAGHRPLPGGYRGLRVRLLDSDVPLQRSLAANHGLMAARGDWLLLLDDDDYVAPSHLEELWAAIGASGARASYSHCQVVDANGRLLPQRFGESFGRAKLLAGNFLPIHTVLFARSLLDAGCRFDPDLDRFEDWDFWLQVAQHTDFAERSVVTAFYRIDAGAGFGVSAPATEVEAHARVLAAKWCVRISPESFLELMELARQHRFMERLQAELSALGLSTLNAEDASVQIPEFCRDLSISQERHAQAARRCQDALSVLTRSRSWRLTAPLRWLFGYLRRGRGGPAEFSVMLPSPLDQPVGPSRSHRARH